MMTMEIEDVALARLLDGPAPHGSGEHTNFQTARDELAAALEGQAPRLSRLVFDRLGPAYTAELAQVVRRAVAVGIRRRADQEVTERLEGAYELLVAGLDQVTDGCTTPEVETEPSSFGEAVDQAIARDAARVTSTWCLNCAGTGHVYDSGMREECDECKGSGKRQAEALVLCGVPTFRDFICAQFRPCPVHEEASGGE